MRFWVMGGGWVGASGCGKASEGSPPEFTDGTPTPPPARDLFDPPLARYGRFDTYTKLGCAAVALALADAGMASSPAKRSVGIVSASRSDCFDTDLDYHQTTLEQGGALASPNLFSYTLPGIVLGECAVHFGLAGPTACVGQEARAGLGIASLGTALRFLAAGKAEAMLAGWIEAPPSGRRLHPHRVGNGPYGALFVLVGPERPDKAERPELRWDAGIATFARTGREVASLVDLLTPVGSTRE
jgi:3-oxoacyl-[acyl-carrier-protein] synthase II